jgi:hypothetical protein
MHAPGLKTIRVMLAAGDGDSHYKNHIMRSTVFNLTVRAYVRVVRVQSPARKTLPCVPVIYV